MLKIGGTYFHSWIYVSAIPDWDSTDVSGYEKLLHYQLSAILMDGAEFLRNKWCNVNESNFDYPTKTVDVAYTSAPENRWAFENEPFWLDAGFVDEYSISNLENDVNTYAALAMTCPATLKQWMTQYPRIKAKTDILVAFYTALDSELKEYFINVGLAGSDGDELSYLRSHRNNVH